MNFDIKLFECKYIQASILSFNNFRGEFVVFIRLILKFSRLNFLESFYYSIYFIVLLFCNFIIRL